MKMKNNYNECITNLACSIQKYFGIEYMNNTLNYIDEILEKRKPQNVIVMLFDGMGSKIIDRVLKKEDLFIKNRLKSITTVFPATTVAATTAMRTGLNPVETGMLGWNMYYKDLDKTITTFFGIEKGDETKTVIEQALNYRKKYMIEKTIVEKINETGIYKGYELFPFGENAYNNLDDMIDKIKYICSQKGKKYIYAYDDEPDRSLHKFGCDDKKVFDLIKCRNNMVEKMSKEVKDTIIFVVADHGHISVENIFLKDYPKITNMLLRTTSLEPRAVNFFVKDEYKDKFKYEFEKEFEDFFYLLNKEEVIKKKLYGKGKENKVFQDVLGDFLAIAKSKKALLDIGDEILKSQHAGYTDDEILIPLIII